MNALAEYLKKHRSYYTIVVSPDWSQVFDMTAPKQFFICLERDQEKLATKILNLGKKPCCLKFSSKLLIRGSWGTREYIFKIYIHRNVKYHVFVNTLEWRCPLTVILHSFQTQQLVPVSALLLL